ncbi:hypothetical protein SAMN05216178_6725 [Pseudomonas saponiphila]|uniref:Uncharacterized protein n=2 Tax=Pseudomonas saponiphila TaxID=556534 RepID=A0A1H4ZLH4_9PSED|nr:hypothetical protein SAMN05216178_6725 [Pseudomonas saponiphila]
MSQHLDEALLESALTAAVDRCIHIDSTQERNIAIRRAAVEEGYRLGLEEADKLRALLERLHPHVRGCDSALWDEFRAALKS